jgi:hypothetical protein
MVVCGAVYGLRGVARFWRFERVHEIRSGVRREKRDGAVSAVVTTGLFFCMLLGVVLVAVGWPAIDFLIRGAYSLLEFLHPASRDESAVLLKVDEVRFLFRCCYLYLGIVSTHSLRCRVACSGWG